MPGFEPGCAGLKPAVIATRPHGISFGSVNSSSCHIDSCEVELNMEGAV